jgi:hypothetical protein
MKGQEETQYGGERKNKEDKANEGGNEGRRKWERK